MFGKGHYIHGGSTSRQVGVAVCGTACPAKPCARIASGLGGGKEGWDNVGVYLARNEFG